MKSTTKLCKPVSLDARILTINVSQLLHQTRCLKALCFSICFTLLSLCSFAQYSLIGDAVSQGGGCNQLTSDAHRLNGMGDVKHEMMLPNLANGQCIHRTEWDNLNEINRIFINN